MSVSIYPTIYMYACLYPPVYLYPGEHCQVDNLKGQSISYSKFCLSVCLLFMSDYLSMSICFYLSIYIQEFIIKYTLRGQFIDVEGQYSNHKPFSFSSVIWLVQGKCVCVSGMGGSIMIWHPPLVHTLCGNETRKLTEATCLSSPWGGGCDVTISETGPLTQGCCWLVRSGAPVARDKLWQNC